MAFCGKRQLQAERRVNVNGTAWMGGNLARKGTIVPLEAVEDGSGRWKEMRLRLWEVLRGRKDKQRSITFGMDVM